MNFRGSKNKFNFNFFLPVNAGIIVFMMILFPSSSNCQKDSSYLNSEEFMDEFMEEQSAGPDNLIPEMLEDLMENPVDLNAAGVPDLQRIPFINSSTAILIIRHREKFGPFFSANELYSISAIPADLVGKIIPFVKTEQEKESKSEENFLNNLIENSAVIIRSRSTNDLQKRKGFAEKKFAGSRMGLYNRVLAKYEKNIQLGFLTDKDAGEREINDFSSFHFLLKEAGSFKNIIAGDYCLEFGQGLVLHPPYALSKGEGITFPLKNKNIRPYTSSAENNFFRGAAATFEKDNLSFSAFFSKNEFDASIIPPGLILSTPVDGLHRTTKELENRKTAQERFIGVRADYSFPDFLLTGLLYYNSKIDPPYLSSGVHSIRGEEFRFLSCYYNFFPASFNLTGEFAYNGISVASINNLQFNAGKNLTFVSSVRSYPRNFSNLHGCGFGERPGSVKNEFGIYNGFIWRSPAGIISFYYDQFRFPYRTYDVPLPSEGDEFLINIKSNPLPGLETSFRFKSEKKETNSDLNGKVEIVKSLRQNFRSGFTCKISKILRWKGRFEFNHLQLNKTGIKEEGLLIYQDFRITPFPALNISTRIIFFKTDSYASSVYEYENDIAGIMSSPALFDEGIRWYLMTRYKIFKNLTLSFKYSETYKPEKKSLGSGNTEINGNLENRISIQVDMKF